MLWTQIVVTRIVKNQHHLNGLELDWLQPKVEHSRLRGSRIDSPSVWHDLDPWYFNVQQVTSAGVPASSCGHNYALGNSYGCWLRTLGFKKIAMSLILSWVSTQFAMILTENDPANNKNNFSMYTRTKYLTWTKMSLSDACFASLKLQF